MDRKPCCLCLCLFLSSIALESRQDATKPDSKERKKKKKKRKKTHTHMSVCIYVYAISSLEPCFAVMTRLALFVFYSATNVGSSQERKEERGWKINNNKRRTKETKKPEHARRARESWGVFVLIFSFDYYSSSSSSGLCPGKMRGASSKSPGRLLHAASKAAAGRRSRLRK